MTLSKNDEIDIGSTSSDAKALKKSCVPLMFLKLLAVAEKGGEKREFWKALVLDRD